MTEALISSEKSKSDWEKMAEGWRRWHRKFSEQSSFATKTILELAQVKDGMKVLDLACGSGEPSLSLARAVGPSGSVVATDIIPTMLQIARENASAEGTHNIEFKVVDADGVLPFPDCSFDVVTCRFGLMFFANPETTMTEVLRVLKHGGVVVLVSWGPVEKNPRFTTTTAIVEKYRSPSTGSQKERTSGKDPFRFAEAGSLTKVLKEAGYMEISEKQLTIPWTWNGSVEEQFESFADMSLAFKRMYSEMDQESQQRITNEILSAMGRYYDGRHVNFTAVINIVVGKKSAL